MTRGIQRLCEVLGAGGCYEFSIMRAGEIEANMELPNPIAFHLYFLDHGWVQQDCTVVNGAAILSRIAGGLWSVLKAGDGVDSTGARYDLPLNYALQPGEHDIYRVERTVTERPGVQHVYGHFFYAGPGPSFDPLNGSITIKEGHLVSRRILRRTA